MKLSVRNSFDFPQHFKWMTSELRVAHKFVCEPKCTEKGMAVFFDHPYFFSKIAQSYSKEGEVYLSMLGIIQVRAIKIFKSLNRYR